MDKLAIGVICGSHGLAGKCKVMSTSGESSHFFKLTEVTVRSKTAEKQYSVESVEGSPNSLIIKFKGIDTPEQASSLSGGTIAVPREQACPLAKNEWYIEDLKNCTLIVNDAADKKELAEKTAPAQAGTVTDVLEGGAGYLLEVSLSESFKSLNNSTDKNQTVLVPFLKEFIGTVDIKNKTIELMHRWILE